LIEQQKTPLVSVCIPIFNGSEYIREAIDSVLAQTLADWELVVLDNASTDDTVDIVRSYSDTRIRLIVNPSNLGIEANWNKALAEARGRFIKLLPSDDYLLPDCLERQVGIFNQAGNESVVLVCGGRNIIDQAGKYLISRTFPRRAGLINGHTVIKQIVRLGTNPLGEPAAIMFERGMVQKAGQFDGTQVYVIDIDFWTRILLLGDLFVIHAPVCAFRLSAGSCSVDVASLQSRHFSAYLTKLFQNPLCHVSRLDFYLGIFMCNLLALGRRLFYQLTVKTSAGENDHGKDIISQASFPE